MTSPKHLWSGNWEDEESSQDEPTPRRPLPPAASKPSTPPTKPAAARPARTPASTTKSEPDPSTAPTRKRRTARIAAASTLVAAAIAAVIVIATSGGSTKPHQTLTPTPPAPSLASATTPTTASGPPPSVPAVSWLGMELVTVPPGGATVETVKIGSVADKAGLSPGEVILAVNGHQVSGAQGIAQAISGLHSGDKVQLQISHGSSDYDAEVTLGAPPTRYP